MTLKILLDDVAAAATHDLRIDVAAARERAAHRRRETRHRAAAVMTTAVAVAATVLLAVVLLPGATPRATTDQTPAGAPTGLPDRWYYAPPWTPPVTRHPMPAASMVLAVNLNTDLHWNSISGPVLVSADGRSYASLPWGHHDSLVTLSRDGRRVAWVTQDGGPATVHRVELATGKQRDDELPVHRVVDQMVWAGADLWASVDGGSPSPPTTWKLPANAAPLKVCACVNAPLAADAHGRLLQPPTTTGSGVPGAVATPGLAGAGQLFSDVTGQRAIVSPAGTKVAVAVAEQERGPFWLKIDGAQPRRFRLTGPEPVEGAEVLGWAPGGVVLRVSTTGRLAPSRSIRLYDPAGGSYRVISRPVSTGFDVVTVADDVVGTGGTVPGVRPRFSDTDRSHVRFLAGMGWSAFGRYIQVAAAALVLLLAALFGWHLARRRRETEPRDQPAHASGGAGPAGDGG
jgi:hypothetical protein